MIYAIGLVKIYVPRPLQVLVRIVFYPMVVNVLPVFMTTVESFGICCYTGRHSLQLKALTNYSMLIFIGLSLTIDGMTY